MFEEVPFLVQTPDLCIKIWAINADDIDVTECHEANADVAC
jgi:hypothetical protein